MITKEQGLSAARSRISPPSDSPATANSAGSSLLKRLFPRHSPHKMTQTPVETSCLSLFDESRRLVQTPALVVPIVSGGGAARAGARECDN